MASPRSTRQLLGELDALMDQMLALPVEEGAAPLTSRTDPPHSVSPPMHPLAVTMTLLEVAEPNVDEPIATPSIELPEPHESDIAEESFWVQEADLVPDPSPRPTPGSLGRTTLVPVRREPLAIGPPPPIARLPFRQMPRSYAWALRVDRFLAHRTFRLGVVGRLLRSGVGRTVLGVLGILMLLIAAGWLAKDLLHWT
jgi:hypothetical protein